MKKNNRKGFTIVELVIVIAVIAILAGVLIPTFSGIVNKAKLNAALQEAKTIMTNYTASIDYSETTPEKTYYIAVVQDSAKNTYYVFTVTDGVIDSKEENVAKDKKRADFDKGFYLFADNTIKTGNETDADDWPDTEEVTEAPAG